MDVTGALSADAITEADLAVGRYDGAQVELFMTDWEMPEAGKLPLMRGQLGRGQRQRVAAGQDYFVDGGVGRDRRHRFPPAAGRRGFLGVGEVAAETVPAVHRAAAGGHQQRAAPVLVEDRTSVV